MYNCCAIPYVPSIPFRVGGGKDGIMHAYVTLFMLSLITERWLLADLIAVWAWHPTVHTYYDHWPWASHYVALANVHYICTYAGKLNCFWKWNLSLTFCMFHNKSRLMIYTACSVQLYGLMYWLHHIDCTHSKMWMPLAVRSHSNHMASIRASSYCINNLPF